MPSLFHTLNMGAEALYTTRQGVDTSGHNIANAQTPGFSRQRVKIAQHDPLDVHNLIIGNGVYVGAIERMHDKFIERQINVANQDFGWAKERAEALKGIEVVFSPMLAASPADELTAFFNSLQDLSGAPEDFTVRTGVVEQAKNLCESFHRVDGDLRDQRNTLNFKLQSTCDDTSDKLSQMANLNVKIATLEVGQGGNANDLRDQRDRLLREVAETIEVNYYEDRFGMLLVRGPKEVTLVEGGNASKLSVARNSDNDGMFDILCTDWEDHAPRNITNGIDGGSMKALLEVRDQDIPRMIDANNELAYSFANAFNDVHRMGYGLHDFAEVRGRDFFRPLDDLGSAGASIEIADAIVESTDSIAVASSPQAPGDNVIANLLISIKDQRIMGNDEATVHEYFANFVGALGLSVVRADHLKEANDMLVDDLNKRRESVAGVSLDEEATNLLRWQTCFTANSKVITTVDEMLETVLSLKR